MIAALALRRGAVALGFAAAVLCAGAGGVAADDRTIVIGADLPLSGVEGSEGVPVRNAVLLAVEDAGRRGFPGGYRVVLSDLDDTVQGKHDPAQGAQNFKSFVEDARVLAVIGPMSSNIAKVQIPISNSATLTEISPASTAVDLTHGPAARAARTTSPDSITFFRTCASDDLQGGTVARFALQHRWRRAFVIDDNETYGRGIADVFAAAYARDGGTILGREHLTAYQIDYRPLLTKIASLHPSAVFFGGIVSTGGAILRKEMADVGMGAVPYLGGDGLESHAYVPLTGVASAGTYYSMTAPDVAHLAAAQAFLASYRKRFGGEPSAFSPAAYAAAAVALRAIRERLAIHPAVMPSRAEIRDAVAATRGLATPIGFVSFDADGDMAHPTLSIYRIADGRAQFVSQSRAP